MTWQSLEFITSLYFREYWTKYEGWKLHQPIFDDVETLHEATTRKPKNKKKQ